MKFRSFVNEETKKGWKGTVRAMLTKHPDKFDKDADSDDKGGKMNPWAIAHSMAKKGDKPHYKDQESSLKGKPEKKEKYKNEYAGTQAPMPMPMIQNQRQSAVAPQQQMNQMMPGQQAQQQQAQQQPQQPQQTQQQPQQPQQNQPIPPRPQMFQNVDAFKQYISQVTQGKSPEQVQQILQQAFPQNTQPGVNQRKV